MVAVGGVLFCVLFCLSSHAHCCGTLQKGGGAAPGRDQGSGAGHTQHADRGHALGPHPVGSGSPLKGTAIRAFQPLRRQTPNLHQIHSSFNI
ncbi:hypothetical protein BDD12DRAFT_238570 [Trichophaea hybrida]|nr:hypothetical protein BDD12DRAFT_238570 [Trichophaea hybrida]